MSKIIRAPINPKILEWALEDLNLSLEDFAKKVHVKPEQVKAWLNKESLPTYNQLEDISYKILKLPLAVFFLPEPPKHLSIRRKFRTLPDFILQATSYKTRIAIRKADFYKTALFELFGNNPSTNPVFRRVKLSIAQQPEKVAQSIRQELNISFELKKNFTNGYQAFNYYREKLEEQGVFLFQLQLEGDRGFCLLDDEFPIIIINSSDSINSKMFTLFHELIHILSKSDDIFKEVELPDYVSDPLEVFCNKTASEILVPTDELTQMFGDQLKNWNEELVSSVANTFTVSREVILLKLVGLRFATQADYKKLKAKWDDEYRKKKKERKGGSYYINKVSALGKLFINVVLDSYKKGFINDIQVSSFLDMKFTNLPKIETEVFT